MEPNGDRLSDRILVNNHHFLVANKPGGVPIQPDKTLDPSFLDIVSKYAKTQLYLVHRLDRPVSGVVVFARTPKAVANLSKQFHEHLVDKTYLAIVENEPKEQQGELHHWIKNESGKNKVVASDKEQPGSSEAVLAYKVIGKSDRYCFLELKPIQGRKHQIRAQLAAMGCVIKGDVKYGAKRGNKDRSIYLHSWQISFRHSSSDEIMAVSAPLPEDNLWKLVQTIIDSE